MTPDPDTRTMNATSPDCAAAIGATIPPSLWPSRPIRFGVDLGAALEERHRGEGVGGEVRGGGTLALRGGAADAAVVAAQDDDAVAGEVVGDQAERLEAEQLLVAVLRPAAGDQHDGGAPSGAGR